MDDEKITIKDRYLNADFDNNLRIVCKMSDRSMYTCDLEGNNWQLQEVSTKVLEDNFNKFKITNTNQ